VGVCFAPSSLAARSACCGNKFFRLCPATWTVCPPPRALAARRAAYSRLLATHPRATKAATASAIALAGDALAQRHGGAPYCPQRAAAFVAWAACTTPLVHQWYLALRGAPPLRAALLDQLVWAPPSTAAFLFWTAAAAAAPSAALLEGSARVASHLPGCLAANWGVWLPVQLLNFRFVAQPYQILFTNVVGLGWSGLLSTMAQPAAAAAASSLAAAAAAAPPPASADASL
jgi:hypothetical protein